MNDQGQADRYAAAEKIFKGALDSTLSLPPLAKWLGNPRISPASEGLLEDEDGVCDQCDFAYYILGFVHERARKLKLDSNNASPPRVVEKVCVSEKNDTRNVQETPKFVSAENDDYLQNFPDLSHSVKKTCNKNVKRIAPTPVPRDSHVVEKETFRNTSANAFEGREVIYSNRISSRRLKGVKKSPGKLEEVFNISSTQPEILPLPEDRVKKLTVAVDLYSLLLQNGLVPSTSNEMRFLLNIFDFIINTKGISYFHDKPPDECNILIYKEEWVFFCYEVLSRLEHLLVIMDSLTRRNLSVKVSSLTLFPYNTPCCKFLEKIKLIRSKSHNRSSISFEKLTEGLCKLSLLNDVDLLDNDFCSFTFIHERWIKNLSESTLHKDLENLLSPISDAKSLYSLGKSFVNTLIVSLEKSSYNNKDSYKKCHQLAPRMAISSETDERFTYFEIFHKLVLDFIFSICPRLIIFIKYWLYHCIQVLQHGKHYEFEETISADTRNRILCSLKIKLTLAKFLGYVEFSSNKMSCGHTDDDKCIIEAVQAYFVPSVDLKDSIMRSIQSGQLTDTVPWVVQFLCMADKSISSHPYFRNIILTLVSVSVSQTFKIDNEGSRNIKSPGSNKDPLLKFNIILPNAGVKKDLDLLDAEQQHVAIKKSSLLFLKLWIGKLFDNKVLGEDVFFYFFSHFLEILPGIKSRGSNFLKICMDATSVINDEAFLCLCSHFSKMKYWESSNYSVSARYIRPLLIEPAVGESCNNIQVLLEERFLKDHPTLASLIDFVSSRIFVIFQDSFLILMDKETGDNHEVVPGTENQLSNQFNCLIYDTVNRVVECIKLLSPPDTYFSIYGAVKSICLNRLSLSINEWLISSGYMEVLMKNKALDLLFNENKISLLMWEASSNDKKDIGFEINSDMSGCDGLYKLSDVIKNINFLRCQLISEEQVDQDIDSVLNIISDAFHELDEEKEDDHKLLKELYFISWDYVLDLVTFQPQLITKQYLERISKLWMVNKYGDIENRLLCPRVIEAAASKDKSIQKASAQNLAELIFWSLKREILTIEQLQEQIVALLRYNWGKVELDFILILGSKIKDVISHDESNSQESFVMVNIIEFLCESVNDIKVQIKE